MEIILWWCDRRYSSPCTWWIARSTVSKFKISAINIKSILPPVGVSVFIYRVSLIVVDLVQPNIPPTISFSGMHWKPFIYRMNRTISQWRARNYFSIYCSNRTCVYRYHYYTVNFRYKNVTQSELYFGFKNVTQSVRLFVCKNVTQSSLFFAYRNVTQIALFSHIEMPLPPPPISKIQWKLRDAKCH